MGNMSYCRFENTLQDLRACYEALGEIYSLDDMSTEERAAAVALMRLCAEIGIEAADFGVETDIDVLR